MKISAEKLKGIFVVGGKGLLRAVHFLPVPAVFNPPVRDPKDFGKELDAFNAAKQAKIHQPH